MTKRIVLEGLVALLPDLSSDFGLVSLAGAVNKTETGKAAAAVCKELKASDLNERSQVGKMTRALKIAISLRQDTPSAARFYKNMYDKAQSEFERLCEKETKHRLENERVISHYLTIQSKKSQVLEQ